ncbi:MAG: dTDP-4-dehydrorhamnose 3,5-epimerase [Planctomycetales bacterium]|nr:dTDP-4-dehydrorhamnose 3,5-epimerase [Planctomycetales bacterium]
MNIIKTKLPGVVIIEPQVFGDARGFFMETWNRSRYEAAGIPATFVQDNVSFSRYGILRGLHFQNPHPQGKLVYALQGEVFDVAVDIRPDSPTFGQWVSVVLSAENKQQMFVPAGYAHGFCVTSETALFAYKCTDVYTPAAEGCVLWNDPDLGIPWPVANPTLNSRDGQALRLRDIPRERLPSP